MLACLHETVRLSLFDPASTGNDSLPSDGGSPGRTSADGGGSPFRGYPPGDSQLDRPATGCGAAGPASAATRPAQGWSAQLQAGEQDLPSHHRPLSGPIEAAVLSL